MSLSGCQSLLISGRLRVFIPAKEEVIVPSRCHFHCYSTWRRRVQSFARFLGPLTALHAFSCTVNRQSSVVLSVGRRAGFPGYPGRGLVGI
ncbi:hypothetical protein BHM03_00046328 [Ensete ventricosum]|nr:hypothetical protein BHM03_00046328 [Ensete ventricosum]